MGSASIYPDQNRSAWIKARRPDRPETYLDPYKPQAAFREVERAAGGHLAQSGVVLLTNMQCPWRCLMCDLWLHTLDYTVPAGAITAQVRSALEAWGTVPEQVKLYNSGSFFDPAAIPTVDYSSVASLLKNCRNVVVESHPRLVGKRTLQFRDLLAGQLEVAVGLETAHPISLEKLNKGFTLRDFQSALRFLSQHEIASRVFLMVHPPFIEPEQTLEWLIRSAQVAFERGAGAVTLIPTRSGNGAMDSLVSAGEVHLPRLRDLESSLDAVMEIRGDRRAFADTWDLRRFASCDRCFESRLSRLTWINENQAVAPRVECSCNSAPC